MLCVYCGEKDRVDGSEVCDECNSANLPDRHKKAIAGRELMSGLGPLHWKKYVVDGLSWTILCQGCCQEFDVTLDFLKSRPVRRRAYCGDCIEDGVDKESTIDYRYLAPIVIDYNHDPKLAHFLARRDGNFPAAKKYAKEKGLVNV